jgi:DNA uptake protein ComE-like DNA-binding protein
MSALPPAVDPVDETITEHSLEVHDPISVERLVQRRNVISQHRRSESPVPRLAKSPEVRTPLKQLNFDECIRRSSDMGKGQARQGDKEPAHSELLNVLNESEIEEIEGLSGLGERSAYKIWRHRRSRGKLDCVSELVNKVGLPPGMVTKFMRTHGICQ